MLGKADHVVLFRSSDPGFTLQSSGPFVLESQLQVIGGMFPCSIGILTGVVAFLGILLRGVKLLLCKKGASIFSAPSHYQ